MSSTCAQSNREPAGRAAESTLAKGLHIDWTGLAVVSGAEDPREQPGGASACNPIICQTW